MNKALREMQRSCWACVGIYCLALAMALSLAGCALMIQPTAPSDIATYNNQVFQLITQIITLAGTIAGLVGLWIKSNKDKQEVVDKTRQAVEPVAVTAQETATKVEEVAQNTRRGPARATDLKPEHPDD